MDIGQTANIIIAAANDTNAKFIKKFNLSEDMDIKTTGKKIMLINEHCDHGNATSSDNTSSKNNRKGVKGNATFIGAFKEIINTDAKTAEEAEENPHFIWTWGWKISDFHIPPISKHVIEQWKGPHNFMNSIDIGVGHGSVVIRSAKQEILLRAICMRAYDFEFICDFSGPNVQGCSDQFVIGIKKARATIFEEEEVNEIRRVAEIIKPD